MGKIQHWKPSTVGSSCRRSRSLSSATSSPEKAWGRDHALPASTTRLAWWACAAPSRCACACLRSCNWTPGGLAVHTAGGCWRLTTLVGLQGPEGGWRSHAGALGALRAPSGLARSTRARWPALRPAEVPLTAVCCGSVWVRPSWGGPQSAWWGALLALKPGRPGCCGSQPHSGAGREPQGAGGTPPHVPAAGDPTRAAR